MALALYQGLLAGLEDRLHRIERPPVITLTTDFGTHDGYVGTMKGVILALLPDAQIVDISHDITPQQIHEAAFILYRAYRYFPASTVHVAVVDPGVGTTRRPIVLATRHGTFVGPDNGIFTYVLRAEQATTDNPEVEGRPAWIGGMWGVAPNWAGNEQHQPTATSSSSSSPPASSLPRAYHLTNPDYWLASVSNTFHGRDVFAPVAAHLASGATPDRMGEPISLRTLVQLPTRAPRLYKTAQGTVVSGQVIYVDRFGNAITNLPQRLLDPLLNNCPTAPVIEVADHRIIGLSTSYSDVQEGTPVALIGSEKLVEIAVRNASAAQRLKLRPGDPVRITFATS
jgi:S-adenosylmethionine hydrolase